MPVLSRRTSSSPSRNHPRPSTYVNERSWPNHESFHVFAPCIALSNYSRVKFVHTTHLVRTFGRATGPTLGTWRSYLSRSLLEEPLLLETALPAPFDDNHQQPRSSDSLRLEHRANFIPIESGASRSVFIRSFLLLFSSLFSLSLSLFFPGSSPPYPFDTRRSFLVTRPRVLRVHRLRESRSAIRMKAFLKAVSYLCRCPHYGATCREHSSSSSACRGPNNDAPL